MIVKQHQLEIFSNLSGDYNPIHLDYKFAKNTFFGGQIIYGIYQVFCALEFFINKHKKNLILDSIKANFINPVFINYAIQINGGGKKNYIQKYHILQKGSIMSNIEFTPLNEEMIIDSNYIKTNIKFKKTNPNEDSISKIEDITMPLAYDKKLLKVLFPLCAKYLNPINIASLLSSTKIVGMEIPGLNSIYLGLDFKFDYTKQSNLIYNYKKHNALKQYVITIKSPFNGKIKSATRPTLIPNQCINKIYEENKNILDIKPFINQRALVIGASSGIGNVCAKLLALGGASVMASSLTNSFDEKHKNIKQIKLNVSNPTKYIFKKINDFNPSHIYYFATPRINVNGDKLDKKAILNFINIYIYALENILNNTNPKIVFIPSSSALYELPFNMKEYAMSKAMLEIYGKYIEKISNIKILMPRLTRIQTNQTLSVIPQNLPKPSEIILNELLKCARQDDA